jgi:thymidylate synthase
MTQADKKYKQTAKEVLLEGNYKENRTDVSTISKFGVDYTIDNSDGFPLLTTKKMDGARWESLVHELLWYLSGEHHIRNLREHTSIWDEWATDDGELETAYGRFWRRYPIPGQYHHVQGESWVDTLIGSDNESVDYNRNGTPVFDQIDYIIQNIKENPNSRRHVLTAWHPANATVSRLPPCHAFSVFNVQGNRLNLHLTQRSGDMALGVPFNIASYSLLQQIIAQETNLEVGKFHHSITDAHIYCGKGERAEWYKRNLEELQSCTTNSYIETYVDRNEEGNQDNYDHIPNLLKQLQREPHDSPSVEIADKSVDKLEFDDFELKNYKSHGSLDFSVAE